MITMKKITLALAVSLLFAFSVSAASLESVCEGLAKHPHTKGNFTQTKTLNANNRSIKSSGNFIFGLDGIMWNTTKPFPSTLAVSKTQITQTAADGSKSVIKAEDNEIFGSVANTLTAVFSNDLSLLKSNFNVSFKDIGNGKWSINLVPKDSTITAVMKSLTLEGTEKASDTSLDTIIMTEASENTITYNFTDQTYPKELTADEKAFFVAE